MWHVDLSNGRVTSCWGVLGGSEEGVVG